MDNALHTARILLPRAGIAPEKWAVVACDQFTAQPEYWRQADALVGDAPSTLRLILPEAWLAEGESRIPAIHAAMDQYLADGTLETAVADGFVLVEREHERKISFASVHIDESVHNIIESAFSV